MTQPVLTDTTRMGVVAGHADVDGQRDVRPAAVVTDQPVIVSLVDVDDPPPAVTGRGSDCLLVWVEHAAVSDPPVVPAT
jgi:hypothetical protein